MSPDPVPLRAVGLRDGLRNLACTLTGLVTALRAPKPSATLRAQLAQCLEGRPVPGSIGRHGRSAMGAA